MRIAVGALLFEGNTFALGRTHIEDFSNNYLFEGAELVEKLADGDVEVSGALKVLAAAGAEVVPLIATHGGAGGRVTTACIDELRSRLLRRLNGQRVDGIFLALHGAMVTENDEDSELALLADIRSMSGSIPIVITLDLHAHVTPRMVSLCDAIVGYQHYPHDDPFETGVRGAQLLVKAVSKPGVLRTRMKKLAMLVSPTTAGTRLKTPMRELFKMARAIEALPGVLSASYFPSTPWAERVEGGTAFVLVTDDTEDTGDDLLNGLCETAWSLRSAFEPVVYAPQRALELSENVEGSPVILSEMSDAVGAGASGDSATMLHYFLSCDVSEPVLLQIVDPDVVAEATLAGPGATIRCLIGNKIETRFGDPVAVTAKVVRFGGGEFVYAGGLMSGITSTTGPSAVIRVGNITILVTSRSAYEYADEQYAAAGIDVRQFRFVVVKNPMNYRQSYAWAPASFALDTPGAGRADLRKLPWSVCARPFYPMDDSLTPIYR